MKKKRAPLPKLPPLHCSMLHCRRKAVWGEWKNGGRSGYWVFTCDDHHADGGSIDAFKLREETHGAA